MAVLTRETAKTTARPQRRWLWIMLAIPLIILLLIITLIVALFIIAAVNLRPAVAAPLVDQTTPFDGRYLLALSDADMIGTAYADAVLRQIPGDQDTLTIVELPISAATARQIELPASNSVASYSQVMAFSPDYQRVYIAETAQPVDDHVTQMVPRAIPLGQTITMIDMSKGIDNAQTTTFDIGQDVRHLAISPDGDYLAIASSKAGRQLAILPTATLDDPSTFDAIPIERSNGQSTDHLNSVTWHPSGEFVTVGVSGEEVQFYRVTHTPEGRSVLTPHGRFTDGYAFTYGAFTSDGRYYLTSEINWAQVVPPLHGLINPPSEMVSLRFDVTDAMQHSVVSRVTIGQAAESWAINPQEDLIVTVNMGRTYLPDGLTFWPGALMNSLSLLTFDRETGELHTVGEPYGFEGVLPEHAVFDVEGDSLGVVVYNHRDDPMGIGTIELWNVIREGDTPLLERTDTRLDVVRGPHTMGLIP